MCSVYWEPDNYDSLLQPQTPAQRTGEYESGSLRCHTHGGYAATERKRQGVRKKQRLTLLHELGHRLLGGNGINSTLGRGVEFIEDEERRLGLFILDVYKRVYGSNFVRLYISRTADLVMKGEAGYDQSMSNGIFFARKFTAAQRQEALKHLIATNKFELRRRKSSKLAH